MKPIFRYFTLVLTVVSTTLTPFGSALAYTAFQQNAVLEGRPLYDPNECDPDAGTADAPTNVKTGNYVAAGNIPLAGLQVGATTYGGGYDAKYGKTYDKDHPGWYPSNNQQGGVTPYDDNGMGYDGKPLPGRTAFAELNTGSALGGLPPGTKIEIDYNGTKIVAEKDDIGTGGPNIDGKPRAVDLWWETARLLKFEIGSAVITIHAVSADTPVTPISGSATTVTATSSDQPSSCCVNADEASGPLSGSDNEEKAFNFLTQNKGLTGAQAAGLIGNLMQESGMDPHAVQAGGPGRGIVQWSVGDRWDTLVAYAGKQGRDPWALETQLDFMWKELTGSYRTTTLEPLQKAATVEAATLIVQDHYEICGDCQTANRLKFANAAYNLYNKGAPTAPGGTTVDASGGCTTMANGVVAGSIVKTAVGLAWPNPFGKNPDHAFSEPTPAYKTAWNGSSDYTDCSAFVATVMVKSGADPQYPSVGTEVQENYLKDHPEKYIIIEHPTSTSQLRPGDILIWSLGGEGHTEFYLGPQAGGFVGASASLGTHTPQLIETGSVTYMFSEPYIIVARKK
jgi:hypothetical protein